MKSVQFKVTTKGGVKYTIKQSFKNDVPKEVLLKDEDRLILGVKDFDKKADIVEMLIPVKQTRFTKSQLAEVGMNEASMWGAEYLGHTCYRNHVEFRAVECGDRFTFDMTYDEIGDSLKK